MTRRARRETVLTGVDAALLAAIDDEHNLVRACRRLGLTRDRGVYRLHRLRRALGADVVRTARGGRVAGFTRLTSRGRGLLSQAREVVALRPWPRLGATPPRSSLLRGTWTGRPSPRMRLASGLDLYVGFETAEGRSVTVAVDPEVVIVARRAFPTSARNVLPGMVRRIHRTGKYRTVLDVEIPGGHLRAAVTPQSLRALRILPDTRVYLYLKANALRPIGWTGVAQGSTRS